MIDVKKDKEFLKDLINAVSPSGQESAATDIWKKYLESIPGVAFNLMEAYKDKIGNSAYLIGDGPIKILLSAHIDQVNARVVGIQDNGLINLQYTGGIDNRCLPGSKVRILSDDEDRAADIEGAVIKQAMHLDENDKWPENHRDMSQLKVDIGAETKEKVEELGIHPGSLVVYVPDCNPDFGENRICSTSLDDKIGVFIVAEVLKALVDDIESKVGHIPEDHWCRKYTVIGLAATQEETGLRGATVAAKALNPDISIDLDVDFATDDDLVKDKDKIGDISLGKGPVISWGCDKSPRLNKILKFVAKKESLKVQEASSTAGGTDTDAIQLSALDCETTHVAIPNRSMHTQNEVCDWRDVQGATEILVKAITGCEI